MQRPRRIIQEKDLQGTHKRLILDMRMGVHIHIAVVTREPEACAGGGVDESLVTCLTFGLREDFISLLWAGSEFPSP